MMMRISCGGFAFFDFELEKIRIVIEIENLVRYNK